MAFWSNTLLTSVRRESTRGASAVTLTVSLMPAGCILRSTGTVWPTKTSTFPTGLTLKPESVAEIS